MAIPLKDFGQSPIMPSSQLLAPLLSYPTNMDHLGWEGGEIGGRVLVRTFLSSFL